MNFKKLRKALLAMGVVACLALPMVACGEDGNGGGGGGTNVENTPTKLGKVVLSVDENGLATWEAVEGATEYEYTLDGGATFVRTTECAVQLEEGQKIKVRTAGDGVNTRHGNWSEELGFGESSGGGNEGGEVGPGEGGEVGPGEGGEGNEDDPNEGGGEVTSLEAPVVTIDHTTGIASWEAVKGATHYVISVDNSNTSQIKEIITETSWQIPELYGGVKVRAKTGEVESTWSVWKAWDKTQYNPGGEVTPPEEGELEKLVSPEITLEENVATWSAVEGASRYVYKVGENGTENEASEPLEITLNEGEALYVKAVGDNETYSDSDWVIGTTFEKTKLATPATINLNGSTLEWAPVTGATSYVVEINGVEKTTTATSYELTETATVRVKAVSTNTAVYSDSDWTDEVKYKKPAVSLGTVSAEITNNIVKWSAVANASEYDYSFDGGATVAGTTTNTTISIDYNQSVVIRAKGDGTTYANGAWSTPVTNTTAYILHNCDTTTGFAGGITFAQNTDATYIKEGTASVKANGVTTNAIWTTIQLTKNGVPVTPANLDSLGFSAIQFDVYNAEASAVNLFLSTRQAKEDNTALAVGWNKVTVSIATLKSEIQANASQLDASGNFYLQVVGNVYFDNVIGIVGDGSSSGGNSGTETPPVVDDSVLNNFDSVSDMGWLPGQFAKSKTANGVTITNTSGGDLVYPTISIYLTKPDGSYYTDAEVEAFETLTVVVNVTNGAGAKFCLGANGDSGAILVEGENTITFTKAQLIASTQLFVDTGMFYVTVSSFTTNMQLEFVSATKA